MEYKYNFSIIIPHKNSINLLRRCLSSIPARNDVQVIVVDDNSDPQLVDFDNFPYKNQPNIELYFTKEGKGAGFARNIGLKHATGKWLLFADADDYYTPEVSSLFDFYAENNDFDIIYLNAQYVDDNENKTPYVSSFYINNFLKKKLWAESTLRYELWAPWTRMVKHSFIKKHNLRFEEIPIGNDLRFGLESSKFAKKISAFPLIVYNYYRPINGSITAHKYSVQTYELRLNIAKWMNDFFKEVNYAFPRSYYNLFKLDSFISINERNIASNIKKTFIHREKINYFHEYYKLSKRALAKILKILS